jgi:hemerythrin-like domain-containing protein
MKSERRKFLLTTASLGVVPWLAFPTFVRAEDKEKKDEPDEGISATEDLMREHGVLNRILLIYEEGIRRLRAKEEIPPDVFFKPATLVRKFVEDYHERNEENYIFPEFEKRKQQVELVQTLRKQHEAGRELTDTILRTATAGQFLKPESKQVVIACCATFIRMYRPHEAREDTVLFPALYKIISAQQIKDLGEQFEQKEHELLGSDGFEKAVDEVSAVEKQLGIEDLAKFTPK